MSWQGYLDSELMKRGYVDKGAICSVNGEAFWALSPGFTVSLEEIKTIANALKSNDIYQQLSGIVKVAGIKYIVVTADGRFIKARQGKEGIVIAKTIQTIIIAHHNDNTLASICAVEVARLSDYFLENGL